jgi:hypothetical protein
MAGFMPITSHSGDNCSFIGFAALVIDWAQRPVPPLAVAITSSIDLVIARPHWVILAYNIGPLGRSQPHACDLSLFS